MRRVVLVLVCLWSHLEMLVVCLAEFVLIIALLVLVIVVFAGLFGMLMGVWSVSAVLLRKVFWNGITMVCRLIVLVGGFVQAALEEAIPNMLTNLKPSMGMLIWRFFMELAVTIAFTVRIGITATCLLSMSLL